MRLAQLLAALSLVASQANAQPASTPSPLIGTWESIDRAQGGIGGILVLAADNSVLSMVSVLSDDRYTRRGNRVQITSSQGDRLDMRVVITGNTLVQTSEGKSVNMTRIPGSGADTGIVGKWRFPYVSPEGQTLQGTVEYTGDGVARLRLPLQTKIGTYSVSASELTLRFQGAPPETSTFSIDGDVLILQRPDGAKARMARTR